MKTKSFVQALLIVIAIVLVVLICLPQTQYDKSVQITARTDDRIIILGADLVSIKGTGSDYFRIVTGDSQFYGLALTDKKFESVGELPTVEQLRVTHGTAHYVISSDTLMKVTKYPGAESIAPLIFLDVIIIFFVSFILWYIM